MESLRPLIERARRGDLDAYAEIVRATQGMVHAVGHRILQDPALAQDAAQETYMRGFRHLGELEDPEALAGWIRRIAVSVALNMRRARRRTMLSLDEIDEVPVLDEAETRWSESQRRQLAAALMALPEPDRRVCDRRYHGGWSIARLAAVEGVDEPAMRKRLQRIRDRLRKEIEMIEQRNAPDMHGMGDFPAHVVELLSRPRLTDLPESPVGVTTDAIRAAFADAADLELPEIVDLSAALGSIGDALYITTDELHRIDDRRILRYDLTLPVLMTVRYAGRPLRLFARGKCYRRCQADATHLEAFHQAEFVWIDDRERIDPWALTALVLRSVHALLPDAICKIVPTKYAMCRQAWELEVEHDGRSLEVIAWGIYTDTIVRHLGGDPARHAACGIGYGLDRLAGLRYKIDDLRHVELARV